MLCRGRRQHTVHSSFHDSHYIRGLSLRTEYGAKTNPILTQSFTQIENISSVRTTAQNQSRLGFQTSKRSPLHFTVFFCCCLFAQLKHIFSFPLLFSVKSELLGKYKITAVVRTKSAAKLVKPYRG